MKKYIALALTAGAFIIPNSAGAAGYPSCDSVTDYMPGSKPYVTVGLGSGYGSYDSPTIIDGREANAAATAFGGRYGDKTTITMTVAEEGKSPFLTKTTTDTGGTVASVTASITPTTEQGPIVVSASADIAYWAKSGTATCTATASKTFSHSPPPPAPTYTPSPCSYCTHTPLPPGEDIYDSYPDEPAPFDRTTGKKFPTPTITKGASFVLKQGEHCKTTYKKDPVKASVRPRGGKWTTVTASDPCNGWDSDETHGSKFDLVRDWPSSIMTFEPDAGKRVRHFDWRIGGKHGTFRVRSRHHHRGGYYSTEHVNRSDDYDEYWNYCLRKFKDILSENNGDLYCKKRVWNPASSWWTTKVKVIQAHGG
jgi:hypothetical protein